MNLYTTLAIDLDGTALRPDSTLSAHTISVLIAAQEQGMRLIIASGRPPQGVAHVATAVRLRDFGGHVLAFNGGELWDWGTPRLLEAHSLPASAKATAYHVAKAHGAEILTYHDGYVISENANHHYVSLSTRINHLQPHQVDNFLEGTPMPLSKCMIVGEPDILQTFGTSLAQQLQGQANVFFSEPYHLEVVPLGIDKGRGLARLLQLMGERPEQTIAVGDANNDIPMIRVAGLGVAMANAEPHVRAAAQLIAPSNADDGVAWLADRFWLQAK